MKNICFVSNFEKTYIFKKITDSLSEEYQVFWICVSSKYYEFLKSEGVKSENILFIPKNYSGTETCEGDYKLNELVSFDRFLSKNIAEGISYLSKIQSPISSFLKRNEIKYVFGELTWAHELLISRITTKLDCCDYYNPHTVRIPSDRFAFYKDEKELFVVPSGDVDESFTIELKKPDYLIKNNEILQKQKSVGSKINRAKRYFTKENIDKNDPSLLGDNKERLKRGLNEELNKVSYGMSVPLISIDEIKGRKYVLYPLHKQPEASIDVLGRYMNNQTDNILNIWRILPPDVILLVKEHSNAIGDRDAKFFKELVKYPNIYIVDHHADTRTLLENSEAIFTVTGTIAYEAGLLGKRAFTFSEMFFNKLDGVNRIELSDFRYCSSFDDLIKRSEERNKEKLNRKEFEKYFLGHTFKGSWNPSLETTFQEENIQNLINAIERLTNI